jgi:protein CpxP
MTMLRLSVLPVLAVLAFAPAARAQGQPQGPSQSLQRLHDALHLTPDQEGAWRTFEADSAPDPMEQARQRNAAEMMPTLAAPRRVDLSIAVMRADLKTLERRGEALKAFYAALTPQQQTVFDQQTAPQAR